MEKLIGFPLVDIVESVMLSQWNLGLVLKTLMPWCLLILVGVFFVVRGYVLTNKELIVRRLLWKNRINLSNLKSAEFDDEAMSNSWRISGLGGFFSISGTFWNQKLGLYRAFATNPQNSIVLRFSNQVIVITPDNPQDMITNLTILLLNK